MEKFNNIKSLLESVEKDAESFYSKGNKSAGTRLRGAMQSLKQLAQEVRSEVQEIKNTEKA
jgi:phage tail tape-measure protein